MRKAVLKRIRITKTGLLMHRKPGKNHFNAKSPRRMQLRTGMMASIKKGAAARKMRAYAYQNNP